MNRRAFIRTLRGGFLGVPLVAEAQPGGKVCRIGALREGQDPGSKPSVDAMRELGWAEGQNLKLERRNAERRTGQVQGKAKGATGRRPLLTA